MDMLLDGQMDDEDTALAIHLMQEDVQAIMLDSTRKGKQIEGSETDGQLAFKLFLDELQTAETTYSDRQMTRSILHAMQTDGPAIPQCQDEENVAEADRSISPALSNGENALRTPQANPGSTTYDEYVEKLSFELNTGAGGSSDPHDTGEILDQPESSSWASSRQLKNMRHCDACRDRKHFADLARAPCQHEYCSQCLTHIFQNATNDESFFPPRCCKQPIPLGTNLIFLDAAVVEEFCQKALEFSTPRRTYCHNHTCARFIPSTNYANDIATCDQCGSQTCITCKGVSHNGECPNDEQLQQVVQLAQNELWQRCQNCSAMVELDTGCNHMTCRCKYEFCYVCGSRWKTCDCPHWEESRLYARAAQIDARNQPRPQPNPVVAQQPQRALPVMAMVEDEEEELRMAEERLRMIEEARERQFAEEFRIQEQERQEHRQRLEKFMADLRNNHECDHERWMNQRGPHECEQCGDVMPLFIYECRQCHIMACRSCRYHVL
ncbi:hypothetical protein F4781DRAFT_106431 [Annulohypoxylon bovei var. microspora]|nr:hypothetical protein F4781DRAFT_106431 [Annulohypoxylon bovei var. microspora]